MQGRFRGHIRFPSESGAKKTNASELAFPVRSRHSRLLLPLYFLPLTKRVRVSRYGEEEEGTVPVMPNHSAKSVLSESDIYPSQSCDTYPSQSGDTYPSQSGESHAEPFGGNFGKSCIFKKKDANPKLRTGS